MKKTQAALMTGGSLRLHKVASNIPDVVNAFPPEDRSADLENLDLCILAVAAVAYHKMFYTDNECELGFVLGKSKLSPKHGHTVPRLELCSAVLVTEIASAVKNHMDIPFHDTYFYSDSKVVLGYLYNRTRRFYTYVSNRVERILHV